MTTYLIKEKIIMPKPLEERVREMFDERYESSTLWEDAVNNKNSGVHSLYSFLDSVVALIQNETIERCKEAMPGEPANANFFWKIETLEAVTDYRTQAIENITKLQGGV